jgi:hypothetical protein
MSAPFGAERFLQPDNLGHEAVVRSVTALGSRRPRRSSATTRRARARRRVRASALVSSWVAQGSAWSPKGVAGCWLAPQPMRS